MIYKVTIYQIDENNKEASTRIYAGWKKNENRFDFKDYTKKYDLQFEYVNNMSDESLITVVKSIFSVIKFEIPIPDDFPSDMHRITTSDVLQIGETYYYISISKDIDITDRIV